MNDAKNRSSKSILFIRLKFFLSRDIKINRDVLLHNLFSINFFVRKIFVERSIYICIGIYKIN